MTTPPPPDTPLLIGWRERIGLPDLGIPTMRAKVDTGARTAALHAEDLRPEARDGVEGVDFLLPTGRHAVARAWAPLVDRRAVRNTSGVPEERVVIRTRLVIGAAAWPIEVTLADRGPMTFDIILGRTAFDGRRVLIDPHAAYLQDPPRRRALRKGDTR